MYQKSYEGIGLSQNGPSEGTQKKSLKRNLQLNLKHS